VGIVTGVVGAAGSLGGFFLPSALGGAAKDMTGSCAAGLTVFFVVFAFGSLVLLELGTRWRLRWPTHAVERAGIFCYRKVLAAGVSRTSA
jgi:NNP family nitrate/nitrite transporter-like MFS transporter